MASENVPDVTSTGQVQSARLYEQFHATMLARAQQGQEDKEANAQAIMEAQMAAILTADNVGEIWAGDMGGTVQVKDAYDLEVKILSFRPDISDREDIDNSHGYYVTMDAVVLGGPSELLQKLGLKLGQTFVLQTGAELFVTKVATFEANGLLPVEGTIHGAKTRSGYKVAKFWPRAERVS